MLKVIFIVKKVGLAGGTSLLSVALDLWLSTGDHIIR